MKRIGKISLVCVMLSLLILSCKKKDDDDAVAPGTTDHMAPVITLLGDHYVTMARNTSYNDSGATATDDVDGDISHKVMISTDLDSSKFGLYNVVYTVKDNAGNEAKPKVRNVQVVIGRDDYLGAYNVQMDENCPAAFQLNSPQQIIAGSAPDEIIFDNFFPLIGGQVPARVDGRQVTIIPTTLQSFLNISGSGQIDENGTILGMDLTIENTLPIVGGTENCQATYTRL